MPSIARWAVRILSLAFAAAMLGAQVPSERVPLRFAVREADGTPVPRAECYLVAKLPDEAPRSSAQWTDERGERDWFLDDEERALLARGATFELVVPLPIGAETRRAWDPRSNETVELRLAPGGKLDLELCDEQGRTLESAVHFRLRSELRVAPSARGDHPAERERGFALQASRGRVLTPPVALDRRFRISISHDDNARAEIEHVCDGPREENEIVTCRLRSGPLLPRLELRLCSPSGAPIADLAYAYRFDGASVANAPPEVRTGSRGELEILLGCDIDRLLTATPIPEQPARLELWAPVVNPRWRASLELAPERLARGGDLGEIRAREIEVGVRGFVVDSAERRLPNRLVALAAEPADGAPYARWERMRATTDAEGRFEIRVPTDIARVRLRVVNAYEDPSTASHPQLELRDVEPRSPRSLDLRVELLARGEIEGRILMENPLQARDLELLIEDARGDLRQRQPLTSMGLPSGRFAFHDLAAGEYFTLRIGIAMPLVTPQPSGTGFRLDRHGRAGLCELRVLSDLALPSNGTRCTDPRLEEIDLRGALVHRELSVLDAADRPLTQETLHLARRSQDGSLRSLSVRTDAQGCARWWSLGDERELWLGRMGHALVPLDRQALRQTAKLSAEPPHELELVLEDPAPELPPRTRLVVYLRCHAVPELWVAAGGADISDHVIEVRQGRARFALSYPGTYHVYWRLESERSGLPQILWQDFVTRRSVIVKAQPGLQRQSLSWPREEIVEALRRTRR